MSTRVAPASNEFFTSSKIATYSFVTRSRPMMSFRYELTRNVSVVVTNGFLQRRYGRTWGSAYARMYRNVKQQLANVQKFPGRERTLRRRAFRKHRTALGRPHRSCWCARTARVKRMHTVCTTRRSRVLVGRIRDAAICGSIRASRLRNAPPCGRPKQPANQRWQGRFAQPGAVSRVVAWSTVSFNC